MVTTIPEARKRPGVVYVVADNGLELPVVDITHPAFVEHYSAYELETLAAVTMRSLKRSKWIPLFVHRALARKSLLLRGTLDAMGDILSGMSTYMLKIGPENLGDAYAIRLDREIASALTPVAMRMRLRSIAAALATGIAQRLHGERQRPLHLVNIAGGTGIDSINALLLLARDEGTLLRRTRIQFDILDTDVIGPRFGVRATEALMQDGAPLEGVDLQVRHLRFDWRDVSSLESVLDTTNAEHPVIAISSEGGLFEYGTDEEITSNLHCLRQHSIADSFFAATAIKDVPIARLNRERSNMPIRISDIDSLSKLARNTGWKLETVDDGNPMYQVFTLLRDDAPKHSHPA